MFKMKNHNTSTNRIEVKESKSEMLKLCRYGYGNFKKQKTIIPSNNMILNTTVQIFWLLLTRKYVCRLVPINCDFSGPAERVRLMTCRLIGNYHDREFTLYCLYGQILKMTARGTMEYFDVCNSWCYCYGSLHQHQLVG